MSVFSRLSRERYDSTQAINASLLKVAYQKSPAHAYAAYRDPNRPPEKDSKAYRIGGWLHEAVLEPEVWAAKRPTTLNATTKAYKEAKAAAEADGIVLVNADEHEQVQSMARALLEHPALGERFSSDHQLNELTMAWEDAGTGLPMKARLDALRFTGDQLWLCDVKTCESADADEFGRAAWNYGYLLQGAFYVDAAYHSLRDLETLLELPAGGLDGVPIVWEFACVEKAYPFMVARYELTPDQCAMGRQQYQQALDAVATAQRLDYWPGYPTGPVPLQLPPWAK